MLRRIKENNPGPLSGETVARLFREIMSACLALEKPLSVAYLGPQGTFTQAAAIKHFGHAAQTRALRLDRRGVPRGGSRAVRITAWCRWKTPPAARWALPWICCWQTPLKVCGEVDLRVHQFLLRKPGATAKPVKVYSHAQSLAQCHEWLNQNLPGVERIVRW